VLSYTTPKKINKNKNNKNKKEKKLQTWLFSLYVKEAPTTGEDVHGVVICQSKRPFVMSKRSFVLDKPRKSCSSQS
jgi:hypothetical protein